MYTWHGILGRGERTCLSWSSARRRLSASGSRIAASKPLTTAESMVDYGVSVRW